MLESIMGQFQMSGDIILSRFVDFFTNPFTTKDVIWMVIPLIVTMMAMETYFARHKEEKLGWNTAIGNSLVLIFVSMDIFRFLFDKGAISFFSIGSWEFAATMLALIVLLEGVILFSLDFMHFWPRFFAFHLSSHLTINLIAYTSIVIVYGAMPINLPTFIAALLFYGFVNAAVLIFRFSYSHKSKTIA